MNESPGHTIPAQSGLGLMLLFLSGALFAIDVAAVRAEQPHDEPALVTASVDAASGTASQVAAMQTAAVSAAQCLAKNVATKMTVARRESHTPARTVNAARTFLHVAAHVDDDSSAARPQNASGVKAKTVRVLVSTRRLPLLAKPFAARHDDVSVPHVRFVAVAPPIVFEPLVAHRVNHTAASKSAVERAQFAVLQMVKAQTRGLRSLSAITRKQGRDRLLVRVIARTDAGVLIESDVLRRNGYGFAIESRKYRAIPTVSRIAAAQSTPLANNVP